MSNDKKEKNKEIIGEDKIEAIVKEEKLIKKLDSETLQIKEDKYKIKTNYRDALDLELLEERYSELLEKYDYIVGDMSYGKLRLRGFYHDTNKKAPIDMKISHLDDYLLEYCSFGCAYFVLESLETKKKHRSYPNTDADFKTPSRSNQRRQHSDKNKKKPYKKNKNQKTKSGGQKQSGQQPVSEKKKKNKPFTKKNRSDKKPDKKQEKKTEEKVQEVKNEKGNTRFQIRKKK